MSSLFGPITPSQTAIDFPAQLTDKYRPRTLAGFAGLERPKEICSGFVRKPKEQGFLFIGPSGTGKTTMALALAETIGAEIHHIPSQECNLQRLTDICNSCYYVPMSGCEWHLILIDEADRMSDAAQMYLLSKLDPIGKIPRTIFVFTCNEIDRFEPRFLSRNMRVIFKSYGIAKDATELLERVWNAEAPQGATAPNFARIVKESNNNIRESLMVLETELMIA